MTVEHCCQCRDHQDTTRHKEEKYVSVANDLREAILEQAPYVQVLLKPFARRDRSSRGGWGRWSCSWRGAGSGGGVPGSPAVL